MLNDVDRVAKLLDFRPEFAPAKLTYGRNASVHSNLDQASGTLAASAVCGTKLLQ